MQYTAGMIQQNMNEAEHVKYSMSGMLSEWRVSSLELGSNPKHLPSLG